MSQCHKCYKIWTSERFPLKTCHEGHDVHESSVPILEKKLLLVPINASHDFTTTISSSDFEGPYLEQKIIELIGSKCLYYENS